MPVYLTEISRASCPLAGCLCRDRVARYPSDLSDAQWEVLRGEAEQVMAELRRAAGRPMVHDLRTAEASYFTSPLTVFLLPGGGHSIGLDHNAPDYRAAVRGWLTTTFPVGG